ncbi:Metallo-dependent phosphatase-like protein [Jimgerdemannia flammicorona]|uniref:Metallo-dependent phosphatase-like protein n=1 Tax=Jimgerdemannia flammicorona TaxID=994334 RepID=A0A433QDR6_9FUNG|nr:Metallo-dependent phosphatase-like protein [Jimgerdemannia flammicorona]
MQTLHLYTFVLLIAILYEFVAADFIPATETPAPALLAQSRPHRIVAVADLHGDYENTMNVFKMAGLVDENEKWAGGDYTTFVQTGDVVDRGDDTIKLYAMLERLIGEAEEAGGKMIVLLGNHELMNLSGDWRFVFPSELATFGSLEDRVNAFKPTGFIGRFLFGLDLVAVVNTTVFCHGGVHPLFAAKGIDWINEMTYAELPEYHSSHGTRGDPLGLFGGNGPTWYRGYALSPEQDVCPLLMEALKSMNATRMVVGHTVQESGRILSRCDGRLIVIDVGITAYYGGHRAALEIVGDVVKAIYEGASEEIKSEGQEWPRNGIYRIEQQFICKMDDYSAS